MAGIYVHLSGRDTDDAILKLNGIKTGEEQEENKELKLKTCIRCNKTYTATTRFCETCGLILDEEEANKLLKAEMERSKADEIMNKLVSDPEVLELIKKKLTL